MMLEMMLEMDESFEDEEIDEEDDLFDCQCSVCHCFTKTNQGICPDCRNGAHRG